MIDPATGGSIASYTALGAQFGGPWGAAAGAAFGLGMSLFGQADQAAQQRRMVEAAIKAAEARNKLNMQEAARAAAEINKQRTLSYIQTAQALQHINKEGAVGTGQANLRTAYADAIGNSSRLIQSDIDQQMNEARGLTALNAEIQQDNLNSSLTTMMNNARSNFTPVNTTGLTSGGGSIWSNLIGATAQGVLGYQQAGGTFGTKLSSTSQSSYGASKAGAAMGFNTNIWG